MSTLNLIQLQERLKKQPSDIVMAAARGQILSVPPLIGSLELLRREQMRNEADAIKAAEMEGAPNVTEELIEDEKLSKETINPRQFKEQISGLMALQNNRQQQAARQQQSIQAAMPMAAPNTTTSEPAQLAGGGFIEDIVVPRDFRGGGLAGIDPTMLKKLALMRAMTNKGRPGLPSLPINMFKRSDYANGGIVAFAGPEGSFVEQSPGFYQLKEEVGPTSSRELLEEIIRRRKERLSLEERMKQAGLIGGPPEPTEEIAALDEQKRRLRESDDIARRVMSLDPLRLGRSMADYLSKQEAAETSIEEKKAKARDLHAAAKFNAARGNIKEAIVNENEADKADREIATAISESILKDAQTQQAFAGKTTDWMRRYASFLPSVMQELKTNNPNDPQVMALTARRVDQSIGEAGRKVDVSESTAQTAADREKTQDYEAAARIVDPMLQLGGSRYKEYKKIEKEEGKEAAAAFRERLIQEELRRMRAGPRPASASSQAPAPTSGALPAGLPPGSKQIGTFNGKPVYQKPDGERVISK